MFGTFMYVHVLPWHHKQNRSRALLTLGKGQCWPYPDCKTVEIWTHSFLLPYGLLICKSIPLSVKLAGNRPLSRFDCNSRVILLKYLTSFVTSWCASRLCSCRDAAHQALSEIITGVPQHCANSYHLSGCARHMHIEGDTLHLQ